MGRAELSVHLPPLLYALALAPTAESSSGTKNFFAKNVFHTKATPFMGRTIFGQVFGKGGMNNFQNSKAPLPGVKRAAALEDPSRKIMRSTARDIGPLDFATVG